MDGFQAPEASQFMSLLFVCMFTFCVLRVQLYGGLVSPDPHSELNKKIAVMKIGCHIIHGVSVLYGVYVSGACEVKLRAGHRCCGRVDIAQGVA